MQNNKLQEQQSKQWITATLLTVFLLVSFGGAKREQFFLPLLSYVKQGEYRNDGLLVHGLHETVPYYKYCKEMGYIYEDDTKESEIEDVTTILYISEEEEGSREDEEKSDVKDVLPLEEIREEESVVSEYSLNELMELENATTVFAPADKVFEYDWSQFALYEDLIAAFYTVDRGALLGNDLINLEDLLYTDLTIEKRNDAPQILIYHTHSNEAFSDSVPGQEEDTIVGVGEHLSQILSEDYGYNVLHYKEEFDAVRDEAYAKSLPAMEALLEEYPTIEVIIDLHRDAVSEGREMVVDVGGKRTAKMMFFNGISRSKSTGEISYLHNDNLTENLAFSFQMQTLAGQYYPGLTRKVYIKQYRYNMHLRGRTLLVELGDESNTVEEAKNACYPLAHVLDMVLSGEE